MAGSAATAIAARSCPIAAERGEFPSVLPPVHAASGVHRIELDLDGYFASLGMVAFHPTLTVDFRVVDPTQHHRISVLITPYSQVSYRSA